MNENTPTQPTPTELDVNLKWDLFPADMVDESHEGIQSEQLAHDEEPPLATGAPQAIAEDVCAGIAIQVSEDLLQQSDPTAVAAITDYDNASPEEPRPRSKRGRKKAPPPSAEFLKQQANLDDVHDMAVMTSGSRVVRERKSKGWSLSVCAKKIGIKRDRLAEIELGREPTTIERLHLMAAFGHPCAKAAVSTDPAGGPTEVEAVSDPKPWQSVDSASTDMTSPPSLPS